MSKYEEKKQPAEGQKPKNQSKRIGISFFMLSCMFYGTAFIISFTSLAINVKVIVVPTFAVLGEASFWVSCIIVGKELMKRYRRYLNPVTWFKKLKESDPKN